MAKLVIDYLRIDSRIDFSRCRGQSYDNAANMAGRYNGMKQKVLEINKYAVYVQCAGHSINRVGKAAVDCCLEAVNFFSIVQHIYNFFSASTHRWRQSLKTSMSKLCQSVCQLLDGRHMRTQLLLLNKDLMQLERL